MFKLSNIVMIMLLSLFLSYCATTYKIGKQFSTEHVASITIGKTTEKDIIAFLGDPWKTGISNGNVVYSYCYEEVVFQFDDSVERNGNTLIIEFDENNFVKNYYYNVPGKEPNFLGIMMHKRNKVKEEQEQVAWQNQIVGNPSR